MRLDCIINMSCLQKCDSVDNNFKDKDYRFMKKMKKIFLLTLLLPMFVFTSCDKDGLSLNDQWIDYAVVDNPSKSQYFFLKTDRGETLWVGANPYHHYRPKSGQRVIVNYTKLSNRPPTSDYDHDVRLNDAYDILTKKIVDVTAATQDSIGRDPIIVRDIWIGSDFMNIKFTYAGYNRMHMINLVQDASVDYNDGKIHLEFRHNAHKDDRVYRYNGVVSFNLSELKSHTNDDSLDLVIHYVDYDGLKHTKEFLYRIDDTRSLSDSGRIPDIDEIDIIRESRFE